MPPISLGTGAPIFDVSDQATLHMDDGTYPADFTAPSVKPIVAPRRRRRRGRHCDAGPFAVADGLDRRPHDHVDQLGDAARRHGLAGDRRDNW